MKRKHQRSIAYLVIALLGISLWHVWKSSKIAENPAYTKGVVNKGSVGKRCGNFFI